MPEPIHVNNVFHWGSIEVEIAGDLILGFQSISYGDKRGRKNVYGARRDQAPVGKTGGKYEVDNVKLKGFAHSIQILRDRLATQDPKAGDSYGNAVCNIIVTMVESDLETNKVEIMRCSVVTDTGSRDEGSDEMVDEIELLPEIIYRNGKTLADTQGKPRGS